MPKRKIRIKDLRRFVFVSDPQISPDGDKVAFVHTKVDYENDGYIKHIWIWDRETGKAQQFTSGTGNDSNPRWSPDGEKLLFLSSKRQAGKKEPQLWVIPSSGGEARLIAELEDAGVSDPEWASDSQRVLFTARVWEEKKPKTDVRVVRRLDYRLNGVGYYPGKRIHLFKVRLGGKTLQLTRGGFDIETASWAPDNKSIAFVTNPASDADLSLVRDIYTISSRGGEMARLTEGEHMISDFSWAPNGEEIAFLGHDMHAATATNMDIWVMPSEGGAARNLTAEFDWSIGRGIGSDLRIKTPNQGAVWSPGSDMIYFLTGTIPTANVYRVDRDNGEVEQLTNGMSV
ncbi:MAG: hypothetical protein PVJ38_04510, partial [Candidatus Bathyarchaeota archaeon]